MVAGKILNNLNSCVLEIKKITIFAPLNNRGRVPQINQ